ncbi:MAG: (2Fe-2S)-binding protein [Bacteroidales bacterium]|nr:(2Fe-2S)-binding protein [Bacteroidales bacterium]
MENSERIVCNCMGITEQEIIDAIKNHGCDTVEKVSDKTEAGTGCGGCVDEIEEIIKRELSK